MMQVFIIGMGRGGTKVLNYLLPLPYVKIMGVYDRDPAALAMETAKKAVLPIFLADPIATLKTMDLDTVFDLTGDPSMQVVLEGIPGKRFSVVTGEVTSLFMRLIDDLNEKNVLSKQLLEATLHVGRAKTCEAIGEAIMEGGMKITGMSFGLLATVHQETNQLIPIVQRGLPPNFLDNVGNKSLVLENPSSLHDLLVVSDTKGHSTSGTAFFGNIRSLIVVPLRTEETKLGVLYLSDSQPRNFSPFLIDALRQFTAEAVTVLQREIAIQRVQWIASMDPLTGLYSSMEFASRLEKACEDGKTDQNSFTLLLFDLDHFEHLNTILGHHVCDTLFRNIAQRIKATLVANLNGGPTLARLESDTMGVILSDTDLKTVRETAEGVLEAAHEASHTVFPMSLSIGGAIYPQHGALPDHLIATAKRSLKMAKKTPEKVCLGVSHLIPGTGGINIAFQPIVNIRSNVIVGYEALVRDPLSKLSVGDMFKKYAEAGELESFKNLCLITQMQRAIALKLPCIFLNVDAGVLTGCDGLRKPEGTSVILELSESEPFHGTANYLSMLNRWKQKGFEFAIDDFGSGFVSFPLLSEIAPRFIKVDRAVIVQATSDPAFRSFFRNILHALTAHNGPGIIAEGVESSEEMECVKEMGIELVQGFFLIQQGYPPLTSFTQGFAPEA